MRSKHSTHDGHDIARSIPPFKKKHTQAKYFAHQKDSIIDNCVVTQYYLNNITVNGIKVESHITEV